MVKKKNKKNNKTYLYPVEKPEYYHNSNFNLFNLPKSVSIKSSNIILPIMLFLSFLVENSPFSLKN